MAKTLSLDETKKLLISWREEGDKKAFEKLVVGNSGLVGYFAKKYLGKGLSFEELVSAGLSIMMAMMMVFALCLSSCGSKAEEPAGDKQNPVMDYIGNYVCDRANIMILATDDDELLDNVVSSIKNDIVREALLSLTTKEQKIILMRYGLDDKYKKTQAEIAELFGCSKQTIAKQEQKALVKMRHPRNTRKLKDFIEE